MPLSARPCAAGTRGCDTRGPWRAPAGDTTRPSLVQAGRGGHAAQTVGPDTGRVGGGGGQGWLAWEASGRVGSGALGTCLRVPHLHLPLGPRGQVRVLCAATTPGEAVPPKTPMHRDPRKELTWCPPPPTGRGAPPFPAHTPQPHPHPGGALGLCSPPGGPAPSTARGPSSGRWALSPPSPAAPPASRSAVPSPQFRSSGDTAAVEKGPGWEAGPAKQQEAALGGGRLRASPSPPSPPALCFQVGLMASRSDCLRILFKNRAGGGRWKRSEQMPRRDPSLNAENEVCI